MVFIRATAKLLSKLPAPSQPAGSSDTALGDWYATTLVVDRRPLLLMVSSESLLPIVLPSRDLRTLPGRLPDIVRARLERFGSPAHQIAAELAAMHPVIVTKTVSRSVVGIMVQCIHSIPYFLDRGTWDESTLPMLENWLAETPWHATRPEAVIAEQEVPRRLAARWDAS